MQTTDCNKHEFIFEKFLVLRNESITPDSQWAKQILDRAPKWTPDTSQPLNRTILVSDSQVIYDLRIFNNLACCRAVVGIPLAEHMTILLRYLRHTIKENFLPRQAKEMCFKLFVHIPKDLNLSDFEKGSVESLTILGDPAPSDTIEWSYRFSSGVPVTQPWGISQPTPQPWDRPTTGTQPSGQPWSGRSNTIQQSTGQQWGTGVTQQSTTQPWSNSTQRWGQTSSQPWGPARRT